MNWGQFTQDPNYAQVPLVVSDCSSGAPAVILRGFFFDNFIFKAPPPGVTQLNC